MHLDRDTKVITVESGVTWGQIQDYVNPYLLAVEVARGRAIHALPYQRYATGAEIRKAYPQPDAFIHKKARYDSNGVFDNTFFEHYRAQ